MSNWLDEAIQKAMEEGQFDNLPGTGKPLNLRQNAYEDPTWRLAYRVLKQSGETLPWIAGRKSLVEEIDQARQKLARAWRWSRQKPSKEGQAAWQHSEEEFRKTAAALNKRVRDFNLKAPTSSVHLPHLVVEREIEAAKKASS